MIRDSLRFQDFGVLLRANHLTRALEETFRKENLPYSVSGGMSFFERQEVRDMLAYLKLIANHDDDTSFLRIVNTPRRGIGRKLLEHIAAYSAEHHCSLFSALSTLAGQRETALDDKSGGRRRGVRGAGGQVPLEACRGRKDSAGRAGAGGGDRLLGAPGFREPGRSRQGCREVEVRRTWSP